MMSSAKAIPEKLTGYILYIQGSGGRRKGDWLYQKHKSKVLTYI